MARPSDPPKLRRPALRKGFLLGRNGAIPALLPGPADEVYERFRIEKRCAGRSGFLLVCARANRWPPRRRERSTSLTLCANCGGCIQLRPYRFTLLQAFAQLCPGGAVSDLAHFREQVVRKRHPVHRSPGL